MSLLLLFRPRAAGGGGGFQVAWAVHANALVGSGPWTMKKNVASQVIGAQMITAADGSAFTGAVTVAVTGDGGAQATGSVGAGACTHEGGGFHTYAPAQAETNYDQIAFTFSGSGAVPATVQVYTTFPQTGDNFARLGAPAGASVSADVAAVKVDTAAILVDTGTTLQGELDAIEAAVITNAAGVDIAADIIALKAVADAVLVDTGTTLDGKIDTIDNNVDAILVDTAEIGAGGAGLTNINLPDQTMNITGDITGNLSGSVGSVTGAVGSVTGNVGGNVTGSVGSVAAGGITASSIATGAIDADALAADAVDEILDEQIGDGTITFREALRVLLAGMAGKLSGAATNTITIRNLADSANVVVATVDQDGNRSAVTVTP